MLACSLKVLCVFVCVCMCVACTVHVLCEKQSNLEKSPTLRSLLFKVTIFCELVVWRILRVLNFTLSPHAQAV